MANCNPGTRQYIGARYVPRHMGEWSADTQYSALDVVLYTDGNSYTAKCYPPKGTVPTDDKYWSLSAQFNQQLAALDGKVQNAENNIITLFGRTCASVKEYGAVGDGVTDDTNAFVTAMSENKSVYVPDGEYVVNIGNVGICKTLFGNGPGSKILGSIQFAERQYGFTFENLYFKTDSIAISGAFYFSFFKNVWFENCKTAVDFGEKSWINSFALCNFVSCNTAVAAVNEFNDIRFSQCTFQRCAEYCLRIESVSRSVNFEQCDFEFNGKCFSVGTSYDFNVEKCYIENNSVIFEFHTPLNVYNSNVEFSGCYLTMGAEDGWCVTIETQQYRDANPAEIMFNSCTFMGPTAGDFKKPFKYAGSNDSSLVFISMLNNSIQYKISTYFDLFSINTQFKYMQAGKRFPVKSDIPCVKSGIIGFYGNFGNAWTAYDTSCCFEIIGTYTVPEPASGSSSVVIPIPEMQTVDNVEIGTVMLLLQDGFTRKPAEARMTNSGLYVFKDSADVVSKIVFNNKFAAR